MTGIDTMIIPVHNWRRVLITSAGGIVINCSESDELTLDKGEGRGSKDKCRREHVNYFDLMIHSRL